MFTAVRNGTDWNALALPLNDSSLTHPIHQQISLAHSRDPLPSSLITRTLALVLACYYKAFKEFLFLSGLQRIKVTLLNVKFSLIIFCSKSGTWNPIVRAYHHLSWSLWLHLPSSLFNCIGITIILRTSQAFSIFGVFVSALLLLSANTTSHISSWLCQQSESHRCDQGDLP